MDCDPTEAVPESKKVADFLKGINDPKLESAVSVVLGDPKMLNNFQMCQQYLSTTVENRATLDKSKERKISGVKSNKKSEKGEKGGKLPKGFKLENKWYPPKISKLLSQEQRNQLKEWGAKKGKRSVAALKNQIKDKLKSQMKAGKGEDNDDDGDESSADDAAGREFGRGAHKKKQKKDENCCLATIAMVLRMVYAMNFKAIQSDSHRTGRCEMDSHADTCVAGANCVVLEYTGRTAKVKLTRLIIHPNRSRLRRWRRPMIVRILEQHLF